MSDLCEYSWIMDNSSSYHEALTVALKSTDISRNEEVSIQVHWDINARLQLIYKVVVCWHFGELGGCSQMNRDPSDSSRSHELDVFFGFF